MDREISKEVKQKERRRQIIKIAIAVVVIVGGVYQYYINITK